MSLFSKAVIAATHNPVVEKVVTGTDPGRSLAHRFVAGDTVEQAAGAASDLNAKGMQVSLDLLGEEVHDETTALSAAAGYLEAIDRIQHDGLDANISIKLTQLGLSFDPDLATESLDRLARAATAAGSTVTVDMEDSRFTGQTLDLYEDAQRTHGNLGVCVQAYLKRTPEDLERIIPLGGHIRLCKGAYVEDEAVAHTEKEAVDGAFAALLERLMQSENVKPAIATHDDRLIDRTEELATDRKAPWEFQMLYGVRPNLHEQLVGEGRSVRIYVPYGSEWYAYLTRRLAERPANTVFFLRALLGKD
ncbi:MAG: proline dehydrogenase family protein [Acidimicrobiia bacterium]|nr:proline dehydrogenase family protein [Acidimicrobiia bacterium]MDH4307554.1 proline dehydrogenase family protein [Acidimicrobiia bacterium]MDH5293784.1 proline dehydrogenase family protein [Acidimicrobiia bacterium]